MSLTEVLRWAHVVGATILLGTGTGIAFFMVAAHRTDDAKLIAHVAGTVVLADAIFTASAMVVQPLTGLALAWLIGWSLTEAWLLLSAGLYVLTGLFWLPVVLIQIRMRDLARHAAAGGWPLPPLYHRLFRIWFACGVPAFLAVLAIMWLMLAKPNVSWS